MAVTNDMGPEVEKKEERKKATPKKEGEDGVVGVVKYPILQPPPFTGGAVVDYSEL